MACRCANCASNSLMRLLKLFDHGLNLLLGKSLLDVLGTVDVPGFDGEDDGPLDLARIVRVTQPLQQLGIILDHPGGAPQLDPLLVGVVHQEDERFGVLRQVAERDVLAVAAEVGEAPASCRPAPSESRVSRPGAGCTAAPRRWLCQGRTYPTRPGTRPGPGLHGSASPGAPPWRSWPVSLSPSGCPSRRG